METLRDLSEEKRKILIQAATEIIEEMNRKFGYSERELDIWVKKMFEAIKEIAELRMM